MRPDSIQYPTLPPSGPTTGNESDELVLHPVYLESTQFNQQLTQQNVCVSNGNRTNTQNVELNLNRVNDKRNDRCTPQECVLFVVCLPFFVSIAIVIFLLIIPIGFIGSICYETYLVVTDLPRWNRSRSRETFTAPFFNWTGDSIEQFCCFNYCNRHISNCWRVLGRVVDVIIWALDFIMLCCVCTVGVLVFLSLCPFIVCVFCIYRGISNSSA